jgi:hypothetical protein
MIATTQSVALELWPNNELARNKEQGLFVTDDKAPCSIYLRSERCTTEELHAQLCSRHQEPVKRLIDHPVQARAASSWKIYAQELSCDYIYANISVSKILFCCGKHLFVHPHIA